MQTLTHKTRLWNAFLILLTTLLLAACGPKTLFDHNEEVKNPWATTDPLLLQFEVTDSIQPYDIYLNIRHTTQYEYANLYLFIHSQLPTGEAFTDTVEVFLADIKGQWLGSGLSKTKDLQILYRKSGRFPMKGKYLIKIEQAMRNPQLEGIESVGMRIQHSEL